MLQVVVAQIDVHAKLPLCGRSVSEPQLWSRDRQSQALNLRGYKVKFHMSIVHFTSPRDGQHMGLDETRNPGFARNSRLITKTAPGQ